MTETKICNKCKNNLSISNFSLRNKSSRTRRAECKECFNVFTKNHYKENTEVYKTNRKERMLKTQQFVLQYLRDKECVDCGFDDIRALEFDHVVGTKIIEVCTMIHKCYSIKNIQKEIEKCEIRCSNCHRIITAKRNNNYRHRFLEDLGMAKPD